MWVILGSGRGASHLAVTSLVVDVLIFLAFDLVAIVAGMYTFSHRQ